MVLAPLAALPGPNPPGPPSLNMARGASASPSSSPVRRRRPSPRRETPRPATGHGGPSAASGDKRGRAPVARWGHPKAAGNRQRSEADHWGKYASQGARKVTAQTGWGHKPRWKPTGQKGGWQNRCGREAGSSGWAAAAPPDPPQPTPALPALPALPAPAAEEAPPPLMAPGAAEAEASKGTPGPISEQGGPEGKEGEAPAGCHLPGTALKSLRDAGWVRMPGGWDGAGEPTWWFPATGLRVPEASIA